MLMNDSPGKYLPAWRMHQTAGLSVSSPLAHLMIRSLSNPSVELPNSFAPEGFLVVKEVNVCLVFFSMLDTGGGNGQCETNRRSDEDKSINNSTGWLTFQPKYSFSNQFKKSSRRVIIKFKSTTSHSSLTSSMSPSPSTSTSTNSSSLDHNLSISPSSSSSSINSLAEAERSILKSALDTIEQPLQMLRDGIVTDKHLRAISTLVPGSTVGKHLRQWVESLASALQSRSTTLERREDETVWKGSRKWIIFGLSFSAHQAEGCYSLATWIVRWWSKGSSCLRLASTRRGWFREILRKWQTWVG